MSAICPQSAAALGLFLLLAACAKPQPAATRPASAPHPRPVIDALAFSAGNIERLWSQIARLQQKPDTPVAALPVSSPGLDKRISLEWAGELHLLLAHLAKASGYGFQEVGRRPSLPIHVRLRLNEATIAHALREAGLQAGSRAGVRVYGDPRRHIELIYTD